MADQIEKFDPSTLMQGVKDRIKATFVSLIPDDKWEQMVQNEIAAFFAENTHYSKEVIVTQNHGYHGGTTKKIMVTGNTSVFRAMVFELCFEKTIDIIKKKLADEWFGNNWPITEENMKENLKAVVKESAPVAMLKFFESITMNQMNQLRSDIQNHRV